MTVSLLSELRNYLVAQGVVRKPAVAGSLPPLWLEPKLGVPAPNESRSGNTTEASPLVIGAFLTGGFAPPPYGSPIRKPIVDFRFRGSDAQALENAELAITKVLIDKRDWMMSNQYVIECEQWRALTRLGSDEQGFEFMCSYWFELLRP